MAQALGLEGYNLAVLHKYLALPMYQNRVKMDGLFLLPNDNGIIMKGAAITSPYYTPDRPIFPQNPTLDPYEYPVPEHPPFDQVLPVFNVGDILSSPGWANGPAKYRDYMAQAIRIWNHYLSFEDNERYRTLVNTMRNTNQPENGLPVPGWTGITYHRDDNDGVQFVTEEPPDPNASRIAGCGPRAVITFSTDGVADEQLTGTFAVLINLRFDDRNEAFWVETLTHELGHALGLGFWLPGSLDADNSELDGARYPLALQALRDYADDQSYEDINLETEGGDGTRNRHWENRQRDGQLAVQNDLMVAFVDDEVTPIMTDLTLGSMVDVGYKSQNKPTGVAILRSGLNPAGTISWEHCTEGIEPITLDPIEP